MVASMRGRVWAEAAAAACATAARMAARMSTASLQSAKPPLKLRARRCIEMALRKQSTH